jgi:hypothetical protein
MPWYQAIVRSITHRYAQAGAVGLASTGYPRPDSFGAYCRAVLVVVVGPVSEQLVGPLAWPAADGWDLADQRQQFGDVVAVAAGQGCTQRDAGALGQDVVLRARPGAVDRARTAFGPRRAARTWEESITALDQPRLPAPCSSARRSSCSCCHTPAWFHSSRRRQQVIPNPNPSSWGKTPTGCRCAARTGAAQHLPVRDPVAPRIARNRLGQQRFDALPQPVRHDPRRLLATPHGQTS